MQIYVNDYYYFVFHADGWAAVPWWRDGHCFYFRFGCEFYLVEITRNERTATREKYHFGCTIVGESLRRTFIHTPRCVSYENWLFYFFAQWSMETGPACYSNLWACDTQHNLVDVGGRSARVYLTCYVTLEQVVVAFVRFVDAACVWMPNARYTCENRDENSLKLRSSLHVVWMLFCTGQYQKQRFLLTIHHEAEAEVG